MKIIWVLGLFCFGQAYAQQYGAEQQKFLSKCNPQNKQELVKSCNCLMTSIDRALTLAEYNSFDERANNGQVSDTEMLQKARLLAQSKPAFNACMGQ